MVARYTLTPYYPGTYDPNKLARQQTELPSQQIPLPPAYYPTVPAELQSQPQSTVPGLSIVRSVFDSRPDYAYDFVFTDRWSSSDFGWLYEGFLVPTGYVCILRKVSGVAYPESKFQPKYVDEWGNVVASSNYTCSLQITVGDLVTNGPFLIPNSPSVPLNPSGVPVLDFLLGGFEVDTFMVVPANVQVFATVKGITDLTVAANAFGATISYEGTLLQDDGRLAALQVGNIDPDPVQVTNQ